VRMKTKTKLLAVALVGLSTLAWAAEAFDPI
jgi:hypothetical protein